jgi:chromate reductase
MLEAVAQQREPQAATATVNVAILVGSLRRDSLNRKLALALQQLCPTVLQLNVVKLGHLRLFNPDLEASTPPAWQDFRSAIRRANAVLFIAPEYNRTLPAALKNALDGSCQ